MASGSACTGAALVDRGFSDVSEGHTFREAINCIAYYGITAGSGDGTTYSPEAEVTRAQMALFVLRTAEKAGVRFPTAPDDGDDYFDDIDGVWPEARDAVNRLAAKGMVPRGGRFRPGDAMTRAEMASFLVALLVEASPNVANSTNGGIILRRGRLTGRANDWFADARELLSPANDAEVSALYELGITRGASPARIRDGSRPPLDTNYEPNGSVDRGQMAAFITRTLAHTPVRPSTPR